MLGAVVPLVRGKRLAGFRGSIVRKLVALALGLLGRLGGAPGRRARLMPCLAAVIGTLDDLAKPAAGLRRIDPIGICRRALHVVHLPAGKVRAADVPFVALAICGQDECAFACTCQNSYLAHALLLV